MPIRPLKYTAVILLFVSGGIGIWAGGLWTWLLPAIAFGLLPLLEAILPPNPNNLADAEAELVRKDVVYDLLLYSVAPLLYGSLVVFIVALQEDQPIWVRLGRIVTMGIALGVLGINVAHELGHRTRKGEIFLAQALLLISQYMHFYIEHNRGHHHYVSTDRDPASSRRGEWVYAFWVRSILFSYLSAWKLENARLRKAGKSAFSLSNAMFHYLALQLSIYALVWTFSDVWIVLQYLAAATLGVLLLETVNYIEHYGLRRHERKDGRPDPVLPVHSWNSNHVLGRIVLFELTRHSDHHYRPGRKYQVLRHMEGAPQMPAGYPAMIVLSLLPPLWFWIMHRQIRRFKEHSPSAQALA
jgi:alkane 1-monooxygenase